MSDVVRDIMGDGFIELRCCEQSLGFVNARLFTAEANERFCALQERLGNAWGADPEGKALMEDPASYGPPADGTPVLFPCGMCGATFTWIGGRPVRVSST
jgi:hypothetical protein